MKTSMCNLTFEEREKDLRIRIDLGLPMVDDVDDFLGACAEAVAEKDETIVNLNQKIEDLEKESVTDNDEIEELRAQVRQLEYKIDQLNATKEA